MFEGETQIWNELFGLTADNVPNSWEQKVLELLKVIKTNRMPGPEQNSTSSPCGFWKMAMYC